MNPFRKWLDKNASMATSVAVLLLLCALFLAFTTLRGRHSEKVRTIYFYDLGTNSLYPVPVETTPPVDTPSGKAQGVQAMVFSCGDCNQKDQFIGYLKKYSPRFQANFTEKGQPEPDGQPPAKGPLEPAPEDILLREVDGKDWVPHTNPEGLKIMNVLAKHPCPPDKSLQPCTP